jgi:hypothetical protein
VAEDLAELQPQLLNHRNDLVQASPLNSIAISAICA